MAGGANTEEDDGMISAINIHYMSKYHRIVVWPTRVLGAVHEYTWYSIDLLTGTWLADVIKAGSQARTERFGVQSLGNGHGSVVRLFQSVVIS